MNMRKDRLLIALLATTNLLMAGGDIEPVTYYETEDIEAAEADEIINKPMKVKEEPDVIKDPVVKDPVTTLKPSASVLGAYIALGLIATRYDTDCDCQREGGTDTTAGLMARAGYDFNQYMGVEARGMRTNWGSDGGKIKHAGVFLKPMYPISNDINVYGLAGYASTTTQGHLRHTDVDGLSFGVGLEYDLSKDVKQDAKYGRKFDGIADQERGFGLFLDYERLFYKSGSPDLDAISAGITYDF
jgi:OOP family OmpA-OmpF porin